jgi:hypothetical protein
LSFLRPAKTNSFPAILIIVTVVLLFHGYCTAKEDEDTYNISLVKTADVGKANQVKELEGKKVLTESYTVKDGEHLWQILREKKLLENRNLLELISVLKKLNNSLENIDMIHPGDKIIIPLVISPIGAISSPDKVSQIETVPLEEINNADMEDYVVRQGDSIIKIVEERYDVPHQALYNQYLTRLKELNPFIKDLNSVYPGQKIRLPIYSPKVIRMPIKEAEPVSEPLTGTQKEAIKIISGQLSDIFALMGEQWLQSGEHFFPLKSGGQLKLNAAVYPIVELANGRKIIVDLYNDLPEKMGSLITSNWDNYAIVHLEGKDDLKQAFDKVLQVCGYKKIFNAGEPFVSGGQYPMRITADRIIEIGQGAAGRILAVNFTDVNGPHAIGALKKLLESSGIKIIEYPVPQESLKGADENPDIIDTKDDLNWLVTTLLDMTGQKYSTNMELPVYQSEKSDINLAVKADFSFQTGGQDHIIDLSGLGKDIISLLKEHQVMVYSLSRKRKSVEIMSGLLEFLGIKYDAESHQFSLEKNGTESQNILLNIEGITFRDANGKDIFATSLNLPQELLSFLNMNGYRVLKMPATFSAPKEKNE